jgi:hypothetical protein
MNDTRFKIVFTINVEAWFILATVSIKGTLLYIIFNMNEIPWSITHKINCKSYLRKHTGITNKNLNVLKPSVVTWWEYRYFGIHSAQVDIAHLFKFMSRRIFKIKIWDRALIHIPGTVCNNSATIYNT